MKRAIALLMVVCCGCQSPQDKIRSDFDKVDTSLKNTSGILSLSTEEIYLKIQANRSANLLVALEADSLYRTFTSASEFIARLISRLDSLDPSGKKLDISHDLIVKGAAGVELVHHMRNIISITTAVAGNNLNRKMINDEWKIVKPLVQDRNSLHEFFEGIPTSSAKILLKGFETKIQSTSNIALKDLLKRITKTP